VNDSQKQTLLLKGVKDVPIPARNLLHIPCWHITMLNMRLTPIPELVQRLIAMHSGDTQEAARKLGISPASLSRWRSGHARPRGRLEDRLRALVDRSDDLLSLSAEPKSEDRLEQLEDAIARTLHALREEFHRSASISTRQEVLDLVSTLFFAHVTSIDGGGHGIGEHLRANGESASIALNRFVQASLARHLPVRSGGANPNDVSLDHDRFFNPLPAADDHFAQRLMHIFGVDAAALRALHEVGRDDLINEVFSRFMSTSFVDEKEMGQYLTPPEITRFMLEVAHRALLPEVRARLLEVDREPALILDPSCGVGSFLAETIRYFHNEKRREHGDGTGTTAWLEHFVGERIVGIDKSERMIRLAMINLGLFGARAANLRLSNALGRVGSEGELNAKLEGRVQLILTNPPFGATYSGADIKRFMLGRSRLKAESEILFLERYIDWLAPGGVVATVVPDSVLANRGPFAELRAWLRKQCSIEAVFSLPPTTFAAAGTSAKTSVLLLRKRNSEGVSDELTYFGEAREVGFDVVTRNGQRRRIRTTRTDLPLLSAEYSGAAQTHVGRCTVLARDADRWDAPFHVGLPQKVAAIVDRPGVALLRVADVAKLVDERVDPRRQRTSEFKYVEISDVDPRTGLVGYKQLLSAEAPSRARKLIQAGDVLVSTVRPERGAVGFVPPTLGGAVCSTGFAVLRCFGIHPLALVWLLKTELVRHQMIRNNIGIAYPAISESTCLNLVLPATHDSLPSLSAEAEALAESQESFELTREAFTTRIAALDWTATAEFAS
jgi:predicted RNA methylase/transcriptional regulator with XRE-family HTH domain